MGRKSSVLVVPKALLKELGKRYIEEPSLTIDQHATWLAEMGYPVARSSLHRYLTANHAALKGNQHDQDDNPTANCSIRLGCLMVAASYGLPGDKVDLILTATELVAWVSSAKPD